MSEFSVDAKGLFEVVGMFEEICRDCDQTGQILSEKRRNVRRIHNIVGNGSPYGQSLKKLEQEIEKLVRCQRNLRSAQRVLGDISNRYDALSQTFEPDFKSLLFGNLESFGAVGGGFTDILDVIHKWRRFKIHNRTCRYSVPDNGGIFRTESEGCTGLFRGY